MADELLIIRDQDYHVRLVYAPRCGQYIATWHKCIDGEIVRYLREDRYPTDTGDIEAKERVRAEWDNLHSI